MFSRIYITEALLFSKDLCFSIAWWVSTETGSSSATKLYCHNNFERNVESGISKTFIQDNRNILMKSSFILIYTIYSIHFFFFFQFFILNKRTLISFIELPALVSLTLFLFCGVQDLSFDMCVYCKRSRNIRDHQFI